MAKIPVNKLKLVTVDITGTIIKTKYPVGQIYGCVAKRHGINVDPRVLTLRFKREFNHMNQLYPNFGRNSGISWEQWWKKLVYLAFQEEEQGKIITKVCPRGKEYTKIMDCISSSLIELFKTKDGWELVPGAKQFLDQLAQRPLVVGVISNFDSRLHHILKALDIHNYFKFVLTSYDVGSMKPDPFIFRKAEEAYESNTGKVFRANTALHVGDTLEADYLGAKGVGWNAALVSRKRAQLLAKAPQNLNPADVFEDITDLNCRLNFPAAPARSRSPKRSPHLPVTS